MSDNRRVKRFLAATVSDYIDWMIRKRDVVGGKKPTWLSMFKNQQKDFDETAKNAYKIRFNVSPDEDVTMEEFIKQKHGEDIADFYVKLKNLDYTNPDGTNTFRPTEENYKTLVKLIKPFINRIPDGINIDKPSAAEKNTIIFYNAIYDTDFDSLSQISQELAINKTQRDADKKHNEDMEALKIEKDKEKEEELMKNTKHHKDRMRDELAKQKNKLEERFKNDDIDEELEESASDEIIDEPATEKNKAKKAAEHLEAKIKEDGIITRAAMDNDFYKQLPEDIKQTLKPKIEEKKAIIERSKVIRYLLPKERPKWEKATMNTGVNPLLSRGAWRA